MEAEEQTTVQNKKAEKEKKAPSKISKLMDWVNQTRVARSLAHFGQAPGVALAGGIAYSGLFSLFAALTLGMSIFMRTLGGNAELRDAVFESVDMYLPGIIDQGDGEGGLLSVDTLVDNTTQFTWSSIILAIVLLFGASSFMSTLKKSLRVMFMLPTTIYNPVIAKLGDFLGLFLLALAILSTAVAQVLVFSAGDWLLELVGLQDANISNAVLYSVTTAAVFVIDALTLGMLFVFVAGARVRLFWDLLSAMALGAIGLGALRMGSSLIIKDLSDNALLAPIAAIATLMIWLNFMSMVLLIAASWAANPPHPKDVTPEYKPEPVAEAVLGRPHDEDEDADDDSDDPDDPDDSDGQHRERRRDRRDTTTL